MVERFLTDDYEPHQQSTYALTLFRHKCKIDTSEGKTEEVEVDFWDTAGQERFENMHPSYYFDAHACLLVSGPPRASLCAPASRCAPPLPTSWALGRCCTARCDGAPPDTRPGPAGRCAAAVAAPVTQSGWAAVLSHLRRRAAVLPAAREHPTLLGCNADP